MRKPLSEQDKRSTIIGVKVKNETKRKLKYIAKAEQTPVSTYADQILNEHIEKYLKKNKIDWNSLSEDEKEGREVT